MRLVAWQQLEAAGATRCGPQDRSHGLEASRLYAWTFISPPGQLYSTLAVRVFLQAFHNPLSIVPVDPKIRHYLPSNGGAKTAEVCASSRWRIPWSSTDGRLSWAFCGLLAVTSRTVSSLWRADIFLVTLERRFGKSSAVRWLILPAGDFGPQDADLIRGIKSEPHPLPSDLDHG
jgi:hypothetical protein